MADKPVHVGSGAFRVDRDRMLEKMRRFQFSEPTQFLDCWLRAASASGASSIELQTSPKGDGFSICFDGAPFTAAQLEAVYDGLFDLEGPEGRRRYYLALGLLGCLRLEPKGVAIASGTGAARMELLARSLKEETLGPADPDEERTRIRIWSPPGIGLPELTRHARRVCAPPTSVDGSPCEVPLEAEAPDACRVSFDRDGLRAIVCRRLDSSEARMRLYVDGVWAEDAEIDDCPAAVSACGTSRQLQLDISQQKVVRDAAFRELVTLARGGAQRLYEETLAGQRHRLREAGRAMVSDPRLMDTWGEAFGDAGGGPVTAFRRLAWAVQALAELKGPIPAEVRDAVLETARVTRWLRDSSVRGVRGWEHRPARPSDKLKPAWTAPVFLDWRGKPLSLLELRTALEGDGSLNWSSVFRTPQGHPFHPVIWLSCPAELKQLQAAFPSAALHDLSPFAKGQ